MKKFSLIFLLVLFCGFTYKLQGYDSNTISVLEFENNVIDSIGNTWISYAWGGTPTYSNTIKKFGNYSAGVFDVGKFISPGTSSIYPKTIEIWVYLPSSITWTSKQTIWRSTDAIERLDVDLSNNVLNYRTISMGSLSRDVWTHISVTYDSVTTRAYVNNQYKGYIDNTYLPKALVPIGGFNATLGAFTGYVDRLILSDIARINFPSDNPFTPTPTTTATITETITETVTPTITQTVTETSTATKTVTATRTVTITVTPTNTSTTTPTPTITMTATQVPNSSINKPWGGIKKWIFNWRRGGRQ